MELKNAVGGALFAVALSSLPLITTTNAFAQNVDRVILNTTNEKENGKFQKIVTSKANGGIIHETILTFTNPSEEEKGRIKVTKDKIKGIVDKDREDFENEGFVCTQNNSESEKGGVVTIKFEADCDPK